MNELISLRSQSLQNDLEIKEDELKAIMALTKEELDNLTTDELERLLTLIDQAQCASSIDSLHSDLQHKKAAIAHSIASDKAIETELFRMNKTLTSKFFPHRAAKKLLRIYFNPSTKAPALTPEEVIHFIKRFKKEQHYKQARLHNLVTALEEEVVIIQAHLFEKLAHLITETMLSLPESYRAYERHHAQFIGTSYEYRVKLPNLTTSARIRLVKRAIENDKNLLPGQKKQLVCMLNTIVPETLDLTDKNQRKTLKEAVTLLQEKGSQTTFETQV